MHLLVRIDVPRGIGGVAADIFLATAPLFVPLLERTSWLLKLSLYAILLDIVGPNVAQCSSCVKDAFSLIVIRISWRRCGGRNLG